jgi:filamentous hemagglutinin family protein
MAPASSVKRRLLPLATLLVAAVLNPVGSFANPTGANVTGGAATVSGQGTSRVTIDQSSDRAFIEWNSFSVAKGESVRFNQPSASSVTANKVVGIAPSEILGAVSANGRIILINPNGVFFGKGSTIDAAGLIATTLDLDKDSFLTGGKLKFSSTSDRTASVVNEGTLTISDAGLGALVAPHVRNSGALVANLGTAVLSSGKAFTVDFAGDGLITFALGEGIASTLVGADGQPLKAQVEQAGEVTAGRIVLSAAAAREVVNQSVNVSGLVRAGSAGRNADGSISLRGSNSVAVESTAVLAAPAGSIVLDADSVKVAGDLFARSLLLTGDHVAVLTGAALSSDGGSILVGGDWQGSNGVRQAITTHLAAGATIDAGQGGKVVLWSDITNADSVTTVAGTVRALGGRIETSGNLLELPGLVQAGAGGTWLIDPTNVSITTTSSTGTLPGDLANAGVTNIRAADILAAVNAGSSVSIIATGTITQSVALAFAPAAGLTGSLTLDTRTGTNVSKITLAGITNSGAGTVNVSAYAAGVIATTAGITSSSGPINLILQSFNATNTAVIGTAANVLVGAAVTTRGGYVILDGTGGTITGTSLTRGSIVNGTVYINGSFAINTTTTGGATSTAGGDFAAAASNTMASSGAFSSNIVTYNIGGKFSVNVATSAAADWGFVTSSYLATSPITAYGDLSITATSTAAALAAANLHVSSALTSTTGSVTLLNTSTGALSTSGVGALSITAAVSGATGVTITNSSAHTATAISQVGINATATSAITSSLGAISISSTTNSTAFAVSLLGPLSAKTGITINATGATATTVATLSAITLTGAGSQLAVNARNTSTTGNNGIKSQGAISLASGSGLSFVTNNLITVNGAISVAANNTGSSANLVFDTSTGTNASSVSLNGAITTVAVGSSQSGLRIRTKGAPISTTAGISLTGLIDFNNTVGLGVGVANAAAGISLSGVLTSTSGDITLVGRSAGAQGILTTGASLITATTGNISLTGSGPTGGVNLLAALSAGSGTKLRAITLTGNGTSGIGVTASTAASLTATGSLTVTGFSTGSRGIELGGGVRSTLTGDVVLSGQSDANLAGVYLRTNPLTVSGGNFTVQGASLVGGIATAMPGTAATGRSYGFQVNTAPISVSGEIDIRGQGTSDGDYGIFSDSTITSTAGNISLIGKGDGGVSLSAPVTAGSGALIRNLSIVGTGTGGDGIHASAAAPLVATGGVSLTGYGMTVGFGLNLLGAVSSTVAGDIVLSGRATATTAVSLSKPVTATSGGIVMQGATLVGGVATAAPGTAAFSSGGGHGLNLASTGSFNASGDITLSGESTSYKGLLLTGSTASTAGNVVLLGKGVDGLLVGGAVNVGGDGKVRSLTITGTATSGDGIATTAALRATGALTLTGYTATGASGIDVGSTLASTLAGDVILSGKSGGTTASVYTTGVTLANALTVASGNLTIQGSSLVGGIATPLPGSSATGSRYGFSSTAAGDITVSGNISLAGTSVTFMGGYLLGDVLSTDGNVALTGVGLYAMSLSAPVTAGTGVNPRTLTITTTGSNGYGLNTAAAAALSATGSIALTAYATIGASGISIAAPIRSTLRGDVVISSYAGGAGDHAFTLGAALSAANGGITLQGSALIGGVATAAPGTAMTSRQGAGFTSTSVGATLTATGDILIRAASLERVVGSVGVLTNGAIVSTLGNVVIAGRGVTGVDLNAPVTAGSGSTIRSLTISGYSDRAAAVSGGGYGLHARALGTLTATGEVQLNAYSDASSLAMQVMGATRSTVLGNIVFSASDSSSNSVNYAGMRVNGSMTATNGSITLQGSTFANGIVSPAPGTPAKGGTYGVSLNGTGQTLSATGDITILGLSGTGTGDGSGVSAVGDYTIAINSSLGDITIIGTSGPVPGSGALNGNRGVRLDGASVTTLVGDIVITGSNVGGGHGLYLGRPITALNSLVTPTSGGSITLNGNTAEGSFAYEGLQQLSTAPIRAWGPIVLYGQSAPISFANWWTRPQTGGGYGLQLRGIVRSYADSVTMTGYSLGNAGWAIHQVAGAPIEAAKKVTMTGIGTLGAVYLLDDVTANGDVIVDGLTTSAASNWSVRLGAPTKTIWSKTGNVGITGQSGGDGLYINTNILAGNAATPTSGGSISLSGKTETAADSRVGLSLEAGQTVTAWGPIILYGQVAPVNTANWWTLADTLVGNGINLSSPVRSFNSSVTVTGYSSGNRGIQVNGAANLTAATTLTLTSIGGQDFATLLYANLIAGGDLTISSVSARADVMALYMSVADKTIWSKSGDIRITVDSKGPGADFRSPILAGNTATPTSGGTISIAVSGGGNYRGLYTTSTATITAFGDVSLYGSNAATSVPNWWTVAGLTGSQGMYLSAPVRSIAGNLALTGNAGGSLAGIHIDAGAPLTAAGTVTLEARGKVNGINLSDSITAGGDITATGYGFFINGPAYGDDWGIYAIGAGKSIVTTGGNITLIGEAPEGGVRLSHALRAINPGLTAGGSIGVSGRTATNGTYYGVFVAAGGSMDAWGSVDVYGQAAPVATANWWTLAATSAYDGVYLAAPIRSYNGAVTLTGYAGGNRGVNAIAGASLRAATTLSVTGVGKTEGMRLTDSLLAGGDISLSGQVALATGSWGIYLGDATKSTRSTGGSLKIVGSGGAGGISVLHSLSAGSSSTLIAGAPTNTFSKVGVLLSGTSLDAITSAVNLQGNLTNNTVGGDTTILATGGIGYDDLAASFITNGPNAGRLTLSAVGANARIFAGLGATITQHSGGGVFLATSDGGDLTPHKIVNNGAGWVVLAAGTARSVGDGLGGQITGRSATNSVTSPNGNVYLFSGLPSTTTYLNILSAKMTTLTLDTVAFEQAYGAGNVGVTALPEASINLAKSLFASTTTSSALGPFVQFRGRPTYNFLLSSAVTYTKVYGTEDPTTPYGSATTAGTLLNLVDTRLQKNVSNTGWEVATNSIVVPSGTGYTIKLNWATILGGLSVGTRASLGTLAGEQASPTAGYAYPVSSTHGLQFTTASGTTQPGTNAPLRLLISKRPLTITTDSDSKTYGDAYTVSQFANISAYDEVTPAGIVGFKSVNGVLLKDQLGAFTVSSAGAVATAAAGAHPIVPSALAVTGVSGTPGSSTANYAITYVNGTLTVNPALVTLTLKVNSANAGTALNNATYSTTLTNYDFSGLKNGHTTTALTGVLTFDGSASTVVQAPGVYAVGQGTLATSNANYTVVLAPGSVYRIFDANPGTGKLVVRAPVLSLTYGDDPSNLVGTTTYFHNGAAVTPVQLATYATGSVAWTPATTPDNVGTYALIGSGLTPKTGFTIVYDTTASESLSVVPRTVTLAATKVYDGTVAFTGGQISVGGTVGGQTLTVSGNVNARSADVETGNIFVNPTALTLVSGSGSASNYKLAGATSTVTITPRALTVSGTKVYDASTAVAAAQLSVTGALPGEVVLLSAGTATLGAADVGSYQGGAFAGGAISVSGPTGRASNYALPATFDAVTVTPAKVSIAASKVYDGNATFTAAANLLVSGVAGQTLTATGAALTANSARVATVSSLSGLGGLTLADGTGRASNYTLVGATSTVRITPRPIGVTLTNVGVTKTYDGTADLIGAIVPTYSTSNLLTGDTVALGAAAVKFNSSHVATASALVASGLSISKLTSSTLGSQLSDYAVSGTASVAATITPATLTLGLLGSTSKVYDGTTALTSGLAINAIPVTSGLIAGDTVAFAAGTSAAYNSPDVVSANRIDISGITLASVVSRNGSVPSDYVVPSTIMGYQATITPKVLTLTGTKSFDGTSLFAASQLTISSGQLPGETVTLLSARGTTQSAAAGTYNQGTFGQTAISVVGGRALASNYKVSTQGALYINPAVLSLNVTGSKVYDATATFAGSVLTATAPNGSTVTLTGNAVANSANVLTASTLTDYTGLTAAASTTPSVSYTLAGATSTVKVLPKPLTVSGSSVVDKVYDGTTLASVLPGTLTGLIGTQTIVVTGVGRFADANVGAGKTVRVSYTIADGANGGIGSNYVIPTGDLGGSITPRSLTLSNLGVPASKVYDGTIAANVTGAGALAGVIAGDTVTLNGLAQGFYNSKDVATATGVSFSGLTLGGASASNYTISANYVVPATITPKPLTVTGLGVAPTKVYDGTTNAIVTGTGVFTGLLGGDTVSLGGTSVGVYNSKDVATAVSVSFSGLTLAGASAANYSLAMPAPVAANITPRALTVSGLTVAASKVYDGTTAATVTGTGVLSGVLGSDVVSVGGSSVGLYNSKDVATANQVSFAGALLVGADASNYLLSPVAPVAATITPAMLTVTANADGRFVGLDDTVGFNGANFAGFVAGENDVTAGLGGSLTITRSNAATGAAGTYAGVLMPSGLTSPNYAMNYVAGDYTIVPAGQLLVKVANASAAYGAAPTYAISSVEYLTTAGNTLTSLTVGSSSGSTYTYNDGFGGSVTFTLGATGTLTPGGALPVGNYALTGSGLSQTGGNFSGAPLFVGNQAVTPKQLTTTASKTYDGTKVLAAANLVLGGVLAGDTVAAGGAGEFVLTGAGAGQNYTLGGLTLTGAEAANYFVDTLNPATNGVITTKALTVTALAANKVYDGLAFTGGNGVTFAGFENGEDATDLGGTLAYGGAAQGAINAGSYALTLSGLTSGNYVLTYFPGTLTVDKAALTVVAEDASRLYGDANPAFTTTLTGFVNGEILATSGVTGVGGATTSATAASAVGAYALVADAGTYAAGNYVFTGRMDGRLSVTPATLTLTAAAASREYGAADPAFAATVTGFKNGETLATATSGAFVFASDATAASGVGQYRVDVSGLTSASGNYVFTQDVANATALTVTPATLTVTAGNLAKTYDGQAFVGGSTLTYAGFRNDETAAVLGGSVSFAGTSQGAINAGTYALTPSGLSADNYIVSFASGTLTVNKAALTLTGADATREYGAADPAFSATLTGFVNGEDFVTAGITGSAGGVSSALAGSPVGTYAYTPTAGTFDAANYAFTQFVDGRVTITPAILSLVAQAATRTYGAAEPTFTGTVTGLRNGDALSAAVTGTLAFTTDATLTSNVGTYGLTGSGLSLVGPNYVLTQAVGNATALTVTPAALTVNVASATKTYDGNAFTGGAGVSYAGFLNGDTNAVLSGSTTYAGTSQGARHAGSYVLSASGQTAANYTLSYVPGTLTVSPKTITATLTANDKVYDGTTAATGALTLVGLVGSETLGRTFTAAFNSKDVAGANQVTASSIQLTDGTGLATDYVLAAGQTASARITPLSVTVTGVTALGRVYDATVRASLTGSPQVTPITGAGDSPVVTGTALAVFGDANAAANKSVTVTGYSLSGTGASNYALVQPSGLTATVAQATLNVLANADAKLFSTADGTNFNGVSFAGFVGADTAAVVGGTLVVARSNATTQAAGTYAGVLQASGLSAQNYAMNYVGGDFTIVPAGQLLIRAANGAATYGSAPTFSISSVEYLTTGGQVLTGLTAVSGSGNSFQYGDGAGGTVDFTLGAANPLNSAGGNLRVGNYTATATALTVGGSNFSGTATVVGALTVTPLARTVTGITVQNKAYDRTNAATFTGGTIASLANDAVSVDASAVTATFADKNVSNGKAVSLFGFTLTGADAGNYRLVQPADVLADITLPTLTITGVTALNKVYDQTRTAFLTGGVINPLLGDDAVLVTTGATGLFADADVGDGKSIVISGYTVIGADAANYLLVPPTGVTANITPLTLTLGSLVASDKVYDGTASAAVTGSLSGVFGGDAVSLASLTGGFRDKNVAAGKTVDVTVGALTGAQAGNYRIYNTTTTAEITRLASVTWTGGAGNSNWFDPANWAGGAVPDLANVADVILPAGVNVTFAGPAVDPAIFGPVSINSLGSAGSLTIAGGALNVAAGGMALDSLVVTGGTLTNTGATTAASFTQSGGTFAGTGAMTFADFTQTAGTTNAGGDFTVTNSYAQANPGVINVVGNASITNTVGPLVMGNLSATGNLSLASLAGPITQLTGSALVAFGTTSATATQGGVPADITLSNAGNDLRGLVTVTGADVSVATSGNLSIAGTAVDLTTLSGGSTSFGATTLTGGLTTSAVGAITQTGPIVTGAPSSITSTTGSITLTDPNNSFFGATSFAGANVSVEAAGNLEALIAATGNASVSAAGNLVVGGTAVNLATVSGGTTSFGVTTLTGGLNTSSVGDITQTGAITTGAASSIASATGNVVLTNPNNSFFGATSLTGVDVTVAAAGSLNALIAATGDASVTSTGNLTVGGSATNLSTSSAGTTSFGATTLTGALTANSVGDITQTGAIITGAPSSVTSSTGDIVLTNPDNAFFGATTLSGVDVSVAAIGDLEALIAATGDASFTAAGNLIVGGSAVNLATSSGGSTSFGATMLTGGLNTTSVGDITQTGAITTGAPSSITSTTGDITLTNPNNSFFGATSFSGVDVTVAAAGNLNALIAATGDASVTSAGNLTVGGSATNLSASSAGTTSFGVTTLTGALTANSVGDITQTGAITTGAPSSITSTTGDITLDNAGNSFFGATSLVASLGDLSFAGSLTGDLSTSSGGTTSFGTTTLTGALATTSVGDITQTGPITTGAPSSITSTTGDITLNNAGNSFFGATSFAGQDVSVAAAANLEALIAATGNASVAAAGNLIVGGTAVNLATNSGGTTSFGATALTGGLTTTSVGDITQTGAIVTGAPSSITSTTGDITLTNPGNSFFGATSFSGVDVTVAAAGNLNALIAATGDASVTAAGNLTVGGSAINLSTSSAGTTSFGTTTLAGALTTISSGDITQTGAITTGAPSSITSSTGDITLNNAGNSFFGATSLVATLGDLSFAGSVTGDLSTSSAGTTSFGTTTLTGALTATSVGDITQTGAITTGAPSSITSTTGDITLNNAGNSFFGVTSFSGQDVSVAAAGALTATVAATGNGAFSATGDLTVSGLATNLTTNSGGATSFGTTTLTGNLSATSVGDITQTGVLTVGGTSNLSSSLGDILLTNPNNTFGGLVTAAANEIGLTASGNLSTQLTATGDAVVTASGNLTVAGTAVNLTTSSGGATSFGATTLTGGLTANSVGDITQTGPVITGAASSLTSSTGDIILNHPGNSFSGATSLTATIGDIRFGGTVNGNLNTNAGGATTFAATTVNGNLGVLSGGDITQTGPLIVTGASSLVSTTGDIVLTNPANQFGGQVTATGDDISLSATGDLDVDFTATGVTTLNNTGNLTVTGTGVDLNVTTLGNAAVGNLTLTGNLNMNVEGFASIVTGATANVAGTATLVSPNSVLEKNGNSLGFADKPRVPSSGGTVGNFVLGATRFNPSSISSTNNTGIDTGLASGQLVSVRGAGLAGFEGVVPKGYVVSRPDAPAPESTARGYHTGDERGIKGGAFRVIYPKVNLGQAYFVGTPRDAEASAEEAEAK